MVFAALNNYLSSEDLPENVKIHADNLLALISQILANDFEDIQISLYFAYLQNLESIDKSTYSAITSVVLLRIKQLVQKGDIEESNYLKLNALLQYAYDNSEDLSALTVESFLDFIYQSTMQSGIPGNLQDSIEMIRPSGELRALLESRNVQNISDLVQLLRTIREDYQFASRIMNNPVFIDLVVQLFELNYISRIEAGLYLRFIARFPDESQVDNLIGANNSESFPSIDISELDLPRRTYNALMRGSYIFIGEVKHELLFGGPEFNVKNIGVSGIKGITEALISKGYFKDDEKSEEDYKKEIYARFEIEA